MRTGSLVALCLAALAARVLAQSPGTNPGLPPSATATGLAPQKITDMAGAQALNAQFACSLRGSGARDLVCSPFASHQAVASLPAQLGVQGRRSGSICWRARNPRVYAPNFRCPSCLPSRAVRDLQKQFNYSDTDL